MAAYDAALKAQSITEAQSHLEEAQALEDQWKTAFEAKSALANPIFDPPPMSSNSRIRALEVDFSNIGLI
jgi:hypothetical protein